MDCAERARAWRAVDRDHRGGARAVAERAQGRARGRRGTPCRTGRGGRSADAQLATDLEHTLYASKIVSYAQGVAQMAAASNDEGWNLELGGMATIWRGGCIIRARFLDRIREAYEAEPDLPKHDARRLLCRRTRARPGPWRRVVARAAELGIRRRRSPLRSPTTTATGGPGARRASIQGLRDLFGAHTYKRIDGDGTSHTLWSGTAPRSRRDRPTCPARQIGYITTSQARGSGPD